MAAVVIQVLDAQKVSKLIFDLIPARLGADFFPLKKSERLRLLQW